MMKVKKNIQYAVSPYGVVGEIPAGTRCVLADNLPKEPSKRYWVDPWPGMSELEEGWLRGYGYLLSEDEVQEETA